MAVWFITLAQSESIWKMLFVLLNAEEVNLLSDQERHPVLSHQTCQVHPNNNRNKMQLLVKTATAAPLDAAPIFRVERVNVLVHIKRYKSALQHARWCWPGVLCVDSGTYF